VQRRRHARARRPAQVDRVVSADPDAMAYFQVRAARAASVLLALRRREGRLRREAQGAPRHPRCRLPPRRALLTPPGAAASQAQKTRRAIQTQNRTQLRQMHHNKRAH
jgi:hypothetical protein